MLQKTSMKIIIKDIIIGILILTLAAAVVTSFIYGFEKAERVECLKLQKQSEDHAEFHLTKLEKRMCDFHDIIINAPVQ
jgi:flagellar basal body-associated protein FliL